MSRSHWDDLRKAVTDLKISDHLPPGGLEALEKIVTTIDKLDPPVNNPEQHCFNEECVLMCTFPECAGIPKE